MPANRDENRQVALILQNTLGTGVLYPTAVSLTNSVAQHVAIVDNTGAQINSFGGGTQYTDGGAAATHPTGTGIIFNNGGTYDFVSAAQPLPITGSITASNPSVSATAAAIPTSATLIGGSDGTNLQPLQVDASKNLKVLLQNSSLAVTGTFWQTTQPVSVASLPLPAGAATAAKQPALGTAGTASADVLSVQGIASMTPLKVDGSATTQPVSLASLPALASGTNQVGSVNLAPTAVGGWTPYFANAVTTTATVSSAAGKFGGYMLINLNSSPAYLQVFDTTGAVTLGTTAPTFVIPIPANATAANGLAANLELANGINIVNGIKIAATTTPNGATTVTVGLSGSIWYK